MFIGVNEVGLQLRVWYIIYDYTVYKGNSFSQDVRQNAKI